MRGLIFLFEQELIVPSVVPHTAALQLPQMREAGMRTRLRLIEQNSATRNPPFRENKVSGEEVSVNIYIAIFTPHSKGQQ